MEPIWCAERSCIHLITMGCYLLQRNQGVTTLILAVKRRFVKIVSAIGERRLKETVAATHAEASRTANGTVASYQRNQLMTILAKETCIYPETLFDRTEWEADPDVSWWALYTKSRHEKKLMRRLLAMETAFYCPMVPRRCQSHSGRVLVSYVPLLSGYVFLFGNHDRRHAALTTNCVSQSLQVTDVPQFVHDLNQIRQLIETGAPLAPEDRLQRGTAVRVRNGPFSGIDGVVVKRHSQSRLVVFLNFLQQGVSVLLDDYQCEPI
jgi:transcriptional antiterminator RfaH